MGCRSFAIQETEEVRSFEFKSSTWFAFYVLSRRKSTSVRAGFSCDDRGIVVTSKFFVTSFFLSGIRECSHQQKEDTIFEVLFVKNQHIT